MPALRWRWRGKGSAAPAAIALCGACCVAAVTAATLHWCGAAAAWASTGTPVGRRGALTFGGALLAGPGTAATARTLDAPAAIAVFLESAPQLQRAADDLALELRPSIDRADWASAESVLGNADAKIYRPVSAIAARQLGVYTGTRNIDEELEGVLQQLRGAVTSKDRVKALLAWDDCALLVNTLMKSANRFIVDHADDVNLQGLQQFALVKADPNTYLEGCWAALVEGTDLEKAFYDSQKEQRALSA